MDLLEKSIAYHLRKAQVASFRAFARHVKRPRATPTQYTTLVLIDANPGLSQVDLGRILGIDRASTMTVIDALQERDWVVRNRSTVDRRKHELLLTAEGTVALRALKRAVLRHEREFAARIPARDARWLVSVLRKLSGE
jgi:DNA-binding MarR family transcriptional regulator